MGYAGPVDDQLLGRRILRRQRRDMACRVGEHPRSAPRGTRPSRTSPATRTSSRAHSSSRRRAQRMRLRAGSTRMALPSGRGGTVYVSRVKQDQILDQTKYEYWNGTAWVANKPSAATPVLPGTTTSSFFGLIKRTTYPTVGEMSVQYNEYEQKYIMLYADQNNNIVMRKADRPEGPWSAPTTLVTSSKMPGLYAPMIHPWSSTTNVPESDRQYLYWNLSTWNDYQVNDDAHRPEQGVALEHEVPDGRRRCGGGGHRRRDAHRVTRRVRGTCRRRNRALRARRASQARSPSCPIS